MSTKSSRVEDRVNRVRQALNSQLLDTGASAPLLSEEAVAVIVAAEARRSRELANKLGPRAYLVSACCLHKALSNSWESTMFAWFFCSWHMIHTTVATVAAEK
jgi:hypothetical protein